MEWDVEKLSNSKWTKKIMGIVLLLLVALLSFNKISVVTSSPETYASMIESLDEKRNTVTGLIATSTATSAAITVLPEGITSGVTQTLDAVQNYLNNLIEAFAIFMVTTCIIPIVVLIILILAVKWIFNSISLPKLQA